MGYVIIKNVQCDSCDGSHTVAIRLPIDPQTSYRFRCGITGDHAFISGIYPDSRTVFETVPYDAFEAEAFDGT